MPDEVIILAGGLGTRLKETIPDLPKCLAPVAGRPFLFYVINYLRHQGVEKFVFSLGYKHEAIEEYLKEQFPTLDYQCSIEKEPLGTGGAIKLAASLTNTRDIVIANGDTLYRANLDNAIQLHKRANSECTLLLKPMKEFDRYGVVETDQYSRIKHFREKKFYERGTINGGLYILNRENFLKRSLPAKFSFETDYLEQFYKEGCFYGQTHNSYFIDIGIPEDFTRAQKEFTKPPLDLSKVNKDWTIFLDRDGVINHDAVNDYVKNWSCFKFIDGVTQAMAGIARHFGKVIVVSNQRGVGRGLMNEADLNEIHRNMTREIEFQGGRIDRIYYCTDTSDFSICRKPNPGMAFKAKKDWPTIDFSKSIMIGNRLSDMLMARNAGMYSVFLPTTNPETPFPHPDIDLRLESLADFANHL